MSLTESDSLEIRTILSEELKNQLDPIRGKLEALRNDIKDIYRMIGDLQKAVGVNSSFEKLSVEKKILRLHAELVEAAKQAGVTLPSH